MSSRVIYSHCALCVLFYLWAMESSSLEEVFSGMNWKTSQEWGKDEAAMYRDVLNENLLQSDWGPQTGEGKGPIKENDPKHTTKTTMAQLCKCPWIWSNISGENWKWLRTDAPHSTSWSLRGAAKGKRAKLLTDSCAKLVASHLQIQYSRL